MPNSSPLVAITEIDLDINTPGISVVHAKQYDTVRQVKAHLFYNGIRWYVPEDNVLAVVSYKKADRIGGFYDITENGESAVSIDTNDRSVVTILLDRNTVTTVGNCTIEITFYDSVSSGRLSTFSFVLQVESASLTELDLASNPYFNVLSKDIAVVLTAEKHLTGLTASATKVAPGASNIKPVISGGVDETPYNIDFKIPTFAGMTATVTKLPEGSNPSAVVTGGTSGTSKYNIDFGIPKGDSGKGITQNEVKYAVNTDGNTIPTSGWVSSITELTIPDGAIVWTRITQSFTEGQPSVWYAKAAQGSPGPTGVAVQTTAPITNVKAWINPNDQHTITIPELHECNPIHFSATVSSFPYTFTDARITTDMRVINCVVGSPENLIDDISWSTDTPGKLVLNGALVDNASTVIDIDLQICAV